MEIIDLGRIDGDEPRIRDWRLFERGAFACAIATLLMSMIYFARALPELARAIEPAACPPAASADAPAWPIPPGPSRGERESLADLAARIAAGDAKTF